MREIHPGDAWKSGLTEGEAEKGSQFSLEKDDVAEEGEAARENRANAQVLA